MSKLLRGLLLGASLLSTPALAAHKAPSPQTRFDGFASNLGYHITVTDNKVLAGCPDKPVQQACFHLDLDLTLPKALPKSNWAIYASFVSPLLPSQSDAFDVTHINGDLYRISPKAGVTLTPGRTYRIGLMASAHLFSPYFLIPNAYVAADGLKPRVIASARSKTDTETGEERLPFVTPFTDEAHLGTQNAADKTQWLTPQRLYDQTAARTETAAAPEFAILPTPLKAQHLDGPALDLTKGIALNTTVPMTELAAALKESGLKPARGGVPVTITLKPGQPESYHIEAKAGAVAITAADSAGAAYALTSLGQQADYEHGHLRPLDIEDAPRFGFRGLHLDLARNFESKAHILTVIDAMARYKLNRLHLHLADDEGWRLQIPGLPELTDIGSRRCHDLKEDTCLLPQLGGGPDNPAGVNGYLTRADYIDILKAAKAHHIEVIPSFDMPGHSRAAVRAMEARYRHLMAAGKPAEASQYRLEDPADTTVYSSIQHYDDNTLNICLPSTYAFIDTVMESIKAMHDEAGLPLHIYHIGTDETAGAWTGSPACQKMMADEHLDIHQLGARFITKVSDILGEKGIEPAGWSDGMGSVDPKQMPQKVQSNSWGGLFSGGAADAYRQANQGWDVVMSTPDVLYLDMPQAADGFERGYDWASRQTDLYKVFAFMPENLGANASVMMTSYSQGATIADPTPLQPGHRIAGMQGQLWSETVRSDAIADYMLFPRTLAVAERAWHRADWEPDYVAGKSYSYGDGNVPADRLAADWQGFQAKLVPELKHLDTAGIAYRLPVPGARIADGKLEANAPIAGLKIEYRIANGRWVPYSGPVAVTGEVAVRTVAPSGRRVSRTVTVKP
ncbi:family 20 glycosylhydrolase [Asticcacaulis solisilvae]|uniref:family 20 glycosylhydrolase n=1 Tax=Asticcacaulis solisilvae TaxID=1217274 RepID=UPI003FD7FA7A